MPTSVALTYSQSINASSASYGFADAAIGAAANDRYLILAIHARKVGAAGTITRVSTSGFDATNIETSWVTSTNSSLAALYIIRLPSGTTGFFSVNFNQTMAQCGLSIYRATGVNLSAVQTATSIAANPSANLSIPADSFGIGASSWNGSSTATWTNLTEQYDTSVGSGALIMSGALSTTAGTATRTVTPSIAAIEPTGVFATFAPNTTNFSLFF